MTLLPLLQSFGFRSCVRDLVSSTAKKVQSYGVENRLMVNVCKAVLGGYLQKFGSIDILTSVGDLNSLMEAVEEEIKDDNSIFTLDLVVVVGRKSLK